MLTCYELILLYGVDRGVMSSLECTAELGDRPSDLRVEELVALLVVR